MCLVIVILASLVIGGVGLIYCVRNYATDSIAELRYMLRCRKSLRKELKADTNESQKIKKELEEEIMQLEAAIQNHWGRRIVRKGTAGLSRFDML